MTGTVAPAPQSSSIDDPEYWWYRARTSLLGTALGGYLGCPVRVLDVGSADGPSVGWMRGEHQHVALDLDPLGLPAGEGVCASALALPFGNATFDVVAAFDVVEHCADDHRALTELARVLAPGGRLLASVPAYQWAWSEHDVRAGHHRRYTRQRFVAAVERSGLGVERSTYAFAAVFPLFAAQRLVTRVRGRADARPAAGLPQVPALLERLLLRLCRLDQWVLRHRDLPFGSSVLVAAVKDR